MANATLSAYRVRVYMDATRGQTATRYFSLDSIPPNLSLIDIFRDFCRTQNGIMARDHTHAADQKVFSISPLMDFSDVDNNEYSLRFQATMFQIESGEWGYESRIRNPETGEEMYTKTPDLASTMPFLMALALPVYNQNLGENNLTEATRCSNGVLMFQGLGVYGVKTAFETRFKKYFSERFPEYHLVITTLCPTEYALYLLENAQCEQITLIQRQINQDEADAIGLDHGIGYKETVFKKFSSINENAKERLARAIRRKDGHAYLEMNSLFGAYDNLKFTFRCPGGGTKVLNLNNIDALNVGEIVPKTVFGLNGHPDANQMIPYFRQMYYEYSPAIQRN